MTSCRAFLHQPGVDFLLVQSFDQPAARQLPQLQVGVPLGTVLSLCKDRRDSGEFLDLSPGIPVCRRVLLVYGCQVTRMLLRGESSSRAVFGRSRVDKAAPSAHFTTETLEDRRTDGQRGAVSSPPTPP